MNLKRLLKSLIKSQKYIDVIKHQRYVWTLRWLKLIKGSRFLVRLHYAFISPAFDQEAQSVINGHLSFEKNKNDCRDVSYFLRRAIHRIEKGLIMRPRRKVFATDYISETVEAFSDLVTLGVNDETVKWAEDVLDEYFSESGPHVVIDREKIKFQSIVNGRLKNTKKIPYPSSDRIKPNISLEDLKNLAQARRSVRWYEDVSVPRELIDEAINVALLSPSACNRQPFRFLIYDDPQALAEVGKLPPGVRGFEDNFPALLAIVGRLRAYPNPRDRHVIYIDGALAAMSFMYALEVQGISSCAINWPDVREAEQKAAKVLNLAPDERIIMFISLGYARPEGLIPYSQKISLESSRQYNNE